MTSATRRDLEPTSEPGPVEPGRISLHSYTDCEAPITETTGHAANYELAASGVATHRDRALMLRMDGVHAGQVVSVRFDDVTFGRHPTNTLVIDDPGVSRFHARIVFDGRRHVLIDMGSSNGTFVMGSRHLRTRLSDGDLVQLGPRVCFRYTWTDTHQEKLLRQLYESSNRDALTGAYNRKHFDERIVSEVAFSVRHRTDSALLLIDIDHFKLVNDSRGHAAGDAVLRQVARLITSQLRTEDVFARFGGEEFAIIVRGATASGVTRLAERLRATVEAVPTIVDARPLPVTISVGCASVGCTRTRTSDELIRRADACLYRAKELGRNRVVSC